MFVEACAFYGMGEEPARDAAGSVRKYMTLCGVQSSLP